MAFDLIGGGRAHQHAKDRVAMSITSGNDKSGFRVVFVLGEGVMKTLGWDVRERVQILLGSGKDHGKLMLVRNEIGNLLRPYGPRGQRTVNTSVGCWPSCFATKRPTTACKWRARPSQDAIEIDLPEWALPMAQAAE